MIEGLGEFGAGVLSVVAMCAIMVASLWAALKISELLLPKHASENLGCFVVLSIAAVIFALLALVFGPAIEMLESYSCRHAEDYELCMDPPQADPM